MAEVVGACDIDGGATARQGGQTRVQRVRRDAAGQAAVRRLRAQPFDVKIEQRRRAQKRACARSGPARTSGRAPPPPSASSARYSIARTASEEPSQAYSVRPLPNSPAAMPSLSAITPRASVQHVRARHLGDVQRLGAEDGRRPCGRACAGAAGRRRRRRCTKSQIGVFISFLIQRSGRFEHNRAFHPLAEQLAAVFVDAVDRAGRVVGVRRAAARAVELSPAVRAVGTGVDVAGGELRPAARCWSRPRRRCRAGSARRRRTGGRDRDRPTA